MKQWRVPKPCDNCPFNKSGPGLRLRKSLAPGRWAEITRGLLNDRAFPCHKTVVYDDDGNSDEHSGLMCAGAIAWQEHRSVSSNLRRVMERLDHHFQRKGKEAEGHK